MYTFCIVQLDVQEENSKLLKKNNSNDRHDGYGERWLKDTELSLIHI